MIHCIRHGQGYHNISDDDVRDPNLTAEGIQQCKDAQAKHFPPDFQVHISAVYASPLTRTIQTAWHIFSPLISDSQPCHVTGKCKEHRPRTSKIIAVPDAQEVTNHACDTGSDVRALKEFLESHNPCLPVDLSLLCQAPHTETPARTWNDKSFQGRYSPQAHVIKQRARATRIFLRERIAELVKEEGRDDIEIALVTHGGFLHYFANDWEGACKHEGTGWDNCEVRSYHFAVDDLKNGDSCANLVETEESRAKRGLEHPMFDPVDQKALFHKTMEGWGKQGLERADQLGDPDEHREQQDHEDNDGALLSMWKSRVDDDKLIGAEDGKGDAAEPPRRSSNDSVRSVHWDTDVDVRRGSIVGIKAAAC
jgi:broad specificity phosphatase PhoE